MPQTDQPDAIWCSGNQGEGMSWFLSIGVGVQHCLSLREWGWRGNALSGPGIWKGLNAVWVTVSNPGQKLELWVWPLEGSVPCKRTSNRHLPPLSGPPAQQRMTTSEASPAFMVQLWTFPTSEKKETFNTLYFCYCYFWDLTKNLHTNL